MISKRRYVFFFLMCFIQTTNVIASENLFGDFLDGPQINEIEIESAMMGRLGDNEARTRVSLVSKKTFAHAQRNLWVKVVAANQQPLLLRVERIESIAPGGERPPAHVYWLEKSPKNVLVDNRPARSDGFLEPWNLNYNGETDSPVLLYGSRVDPGTGTYSQFEIELFADATEEDLDFLIPHALKYAGPGDSHKVIKIEKSNSQNRIFNVIFFGAVNSATIASHLALIKDQIKSIKTLDSSITIAR